MSLHVSLHNPSVSDLRAVGGGPTIAVTLSEYPAEVTVMFWDADRLAHFISGLILEADRLRGDYLVSNLVDHYISDTKVSA